MWWKHVKLKKRNSALMLLAVFTLSVAASGTWVYQEATGDAFVSDLFIRTTPGNHYHQVSTPPHRSAVSDIIDTWDFSNENHIEAEEASCVREIWTPGSPQLQYRLNTDFDFTQAGGTAKVWACDVGNMLLPTCVDDSPGGE